MKTKVIHFLNKPKQVTTISLVVALLLGVYGYIAINKKSLSPSIPTINTASNFDNSQTHNLSLGFLSSGRINSVKVKSGDVVKQGQELASLDSGNTLGALTQAKASYDQAKANYEKLINGATGPAIDVAKAFVNTAKINLSEGKKQQDILVQNAYNNLLNSGLEVVPEGSYTNETAPTISGSYLKGVEGQIKIGVYGGGNGTNFSVSGVAVGLGQANSVVPQAIADTGLFIKFNTLPSQTNWVIDIPNTKASNYLANHNAYESALQTRDQTLALLQANLDQANASLNALVTSARPEDVASAQAQVDAAEGAIQIAQATYNNTIIKAPYEGTVKSVSISVGQIAVPNAPAIELEVTNTNIK